MARLEILNTCAIRERLGEALQQSYLEMMRLSENDVQAISVCDLPSPGEIGRRLRDAQRKYDADLAALKDHLAEHGCL